MMSPIATQPLSLSIKPEQFPPISPTNDNPSHSITVPPMKDETGVVSTDESNTKSVTPEYKQDSHALMPDFSTIHESNQTIETGAKFYSYADFERAFDEWKLANHHPFRVASSETLKMPDGTTNDVFKYRYIVFHCAHYGAPRMRGAGKRPNQNYLPCGCRAMLRLNYSWTENALRITTLNTLHIGHDVSADAYNRFSAKLRRSSPSVMSPMSQGSSSASPLSNSTGYSPINPTPTRKRRAGKTSGGLSKSTKFVTSENHKENIGIGTNQRAFRPLTSNAQNIVPHNGTLPSITHNNMSSYLPSLLRQSNLMANLQASALLSQNPQLFAAAAAAMGTTNSASTAFPTGFPKQVPTPIATQQQHQTPFSSTWSNPLATVCPPTTTTTIEPSDGVSAPIDLSSPAARPGRLEASLKSTLKDDIHLLTQRLSDHLLQSASDNLTDFELKVKQLQLLLNAWQTQGMLR